MNKPSIVVVGSSNVDMTARVDHLPLPGETIGNALFMQAWGGKGANQAVAAARLGGDVTFVTALGGDLNGSALKTHFQQEGINTRYILTDNLQPTGTALIFVSKDAENCIAVAPGANYSLTPLVAEQAVDALHQADILVMQAEIPYATIARTAALAKQSGCKVLLNPAPACKIDDELMHLVDILVVNETEAATITGMDVCDDNLDAVAATLIERGAVSVVITLGSKGVYARTADASATAGSPASRTAAPADAPAVWADAPAVWADTSAVSASGKVLRANAFKVNAVDTTGAGDTFCGALAVRCATRPITEDALRFACAAAALSVTKAGAQPSIPTEAETTDFLQKAEIVHGI